MGASGWARADCPCHGHPRPAKLSPADSPTLEARPMNEQDRRMVLKSAGLGIGAGLLSGIAAPAHAEPAAAIWSAEYWANKGSVKLNLWRKRLGAPAAGE